MTSKRSAVPTTMTSTSLSATSVPVAKDPKTNAVSTLSPNASNAWPRRSPTPNALIERARSSGNSGCSAFALNRRRLANRRSVTIPAFSMCATTACVAPFPLPPMRMRSDSVNSRSGAVITAPSTRCSRADIMKSRVATEFHTISRLHRTGKWYDVVRVSASGSMLIAATRIFPFVDMPFASCRREVVWGSYRVRTPIGTPENRVMNYLDVHGLPEKGQNSLAEPSASIRDWQAHDAASDGSCGIRI